MVTQIPHEGYHRLLPLFENNKYLQLISKAILKGGMGEAYADDPDNPSIASLHHNVLVFLVGNPHHKEAPQILEKIPKGHLILVPNDNWSPTMRSYWGNQLQSLTRTKFSSDGLELGLMNRILESIPSCIHVEKLTQKTVGDISDQAKRVLSILFPNLDEFIQTNFGYCLKESEKIVSLALAATPIDNQEYEIHIETDPAYQRRGLAVITSAKLIQYSLERGLIPHWDADNPPSARLAKKLGFTQPEEYRTYYWMDKQSR
jgi:GNAT superfamily N-acetyltransferase